MNTVLPLTDEAHKHLESWFASQEPAWLAQGADPAEVRGDIVADLVERFAGVPEITVTALTQALAPMAIGGPVPQVDPPGPASSLPVCRPGKGPWFSRDQCAASGNPGLLSRLLSWLRRSFQPQHVFWLAIWPSLVVTGELLMHFCGDMFFDPLPTSWHLAAVVFCILTGLACWRHARAAHPAGTDVSPLPPVLALARGMAMVIAGYWALLQLPLLLMGTFYFGMGVVMSFGIGLLFFPVYWLCAMAAGAPLMQWIGLKRAGQCQPSRVPGIAGMVAGLIALAALEGPSYVTRLAGDAASPAVLRAIGAERALLKLCYEGRGGRGSMTDTAGFVIGLLNGRVFESWSGSGDVDQWRTLYYRVTGRPYNSLPPPSQFLGAARSRAAFDDFQWDPDLGGNGVFARIRGLEASASRLDGHVDATTGIGYWEWTMEFYNTSAIDREARMQILLPPGGVVSRLSLWVDGEPREAAFAGSDEVAKAYKAVAVVQRRDPVLARWVGPDRVLVQCFPVLRGKKMKIRLGTTAPLDAQQRLFFPRLIEQNFGFSQGLVTDLWVQGDTDLQITGLPRGASSGNWREVHGPLPISVQADNAACVTCERATPAPLVWTKDPFADPGSEILVRTKLGSTVAPATATRPKRVIAIDTSASLAGWRDAIADAVAQAARECVISASVIVATDTGAQTVDISELGKMRYAGGRDNRKALELAVDAAAREQSDTVIWLHGPQPVDFGSCEVITQLLERGFHHPKIASLELVAGPNRILETFDRATIMPSAIRILDSGDLRRALAQLATPAPAEFAFSRVALGQQPSDGKETWDQLARLHVWQTVQATAKQGKTAALASRYQLVTPTTGAVVLETREQYAQHGLQAVDPNSTPSIPSVPEPGTTALLATAALFALRRRRGRDN